MYEWSFDVVWDYRIVYLKGALITVGLSLYSVVFSMGLGLLVAISRQSKYRLLLRRSTSGYPSPGADRLDLLLFSYPCGTQTDSVLVVRPGHFHPHVCLCGGDLAGGDSLHR